MDRMIKLLSGESVERIPYWDEIPKNKAQYLDGLEFRTRSGYFKREAKGFKEMYGKQKWKVHASFLSKSLIGRHSEWDDIGKIKEWLDSDTGLGKNWIHAYVEWYKQYSSNKEYDEFKTADAAVCNFVEHLKYIGLDKYWFMNVFTDGCLLNCIQWCITVWRVKHYCKTYNISNKWYPFDMMVNMFLKNKHYIGSTFNSSSDKKECARYPNMPQCLANVKTWMDEKYFVENILNNTDLDTFQPFIKLGSTLDQSPHKELLVGLYRYGGHCMLYGQVWSHPTHIGHDAFDPQL